MYDHHEGFRVGLWLLSAHVETRPMERFHSDDPPIEPGDLLYRVVITFHYDSGNAHDELAGLYGHLETNWQYALDEAAKQARMLVSLQLAWEGPADDDPDGERDHVTHVKTAELAGMINDAIERHKLVMQVAP